MLVYSSSANYNQVIFSFHEIKILIISSILVYMGHHSFILHLKFVLFPLLLVQFTEAIQ